VKKALISPNEPVVVVTDVVNDQPVLTTVDNSARVVEVCDTEFPVCPPLFWVDCDDVVDAVNWYWNTATSSIERITIQTYTPPSIIPVSEMS